MRGLFTNCLDDYSTHGFLILVKELGLLTNPGQWIRGFGCLKIYIYMYCIVNNEDMMNRRLEV
jgi:hypothetical protein